MAWRRRALHPRRPAGRGQSLRGLRFVGPGRFRWLEDAGRLREEGTVLFLVDDLLLDVPKPRPFEPDFSTDPHESLEAWAAATTRRPTYSYCGPSPTEFIADVRRGPPRPPEPPKADAFFDPKLRGRRVAALDEPGRGDVLAEIGLVLPEQFDLSVVLEVTGPVLYCHLRTDADEAVRAVALTMRALTEASVDADAVQRAAKRVELELRNSRIALRDIPEHVLQWRRDGRDSDPQRDVWDGLPMVTAETLSPLLTALRPAPGAVALVGPLGGLELDDLAFIAPPEVVKR